MRVVWTAPFANHKPITSFIVKVMDKVNQEYVQTCLNLWLECRLSQAYLLSLGYKQGDVPEVIVAAVNSRGQGSFSEVSSSIGQIKTTPHKMNQPRRNSLTTQHVIIVDWDALVPPDDGDSDVTQYHLQWLHEGYWQDLYGSMPGETSTTFTVTSGVEPGAIY